MLTKPIVLEVPNRWGPNWERDRSFRPFFLLVAYVIGRSIPAPYRQCSLDGLAFGSIAGSTRFPNLQHCERTCFRLPASAGIIHQLMRRASCFGKPVAATAPGHELDGGVKVTPVANGYIDGIGPRPSAQRSAINLTVHDEIRVFADS